MVRDVDFVAEYARTHDWILRPRTVIVEGTSDVSIVERAARLEFAASGIDLLGNELSFIAAGDRERGGTRGVCRELLCLRGLARTLLLPNGRPKYRFVGLFDNDKAGIEAVRGIRNLDASILEYKDVFRLRPIMPMRGNLDPRTLKATFERVNLDFKGLEWEMEDLVSDEFVKAFVSDYPNLGIHSIVKGNKVHWVLTHDGKARLHRYLAQHAIRCDLEGVVDAIRALRFYLGLPAL